MNSLYTLALRQSSALGLELDGLQAAYSGHALPAQLAALNSKINTAFVELDRTITDYDDMARREMVEMRRQKALKRVATFKAEYEALKARHRQTKNAGDHSSHEAARGELIGGGNSSSYARPVSGSPYLTRSASVSLKPQENFTAIDIGGGGFDPRVNHALRENDFIAQTSATLDTYLAQGQAVLGNLGNQRDIIKSTQRRLLSAANTLGLSRNTIQYIERRTSSDYFVIILGGLATLICFYFILKYFG